MSSFGGLVAAIAIALVVLSSLAAIIDITNRSMISTSETSKYALKQRSESRISSVVLKGTLLLFNVTNTGATSVRVKDFPKIDLVVVARSNGAATVLRLNYSKSLSTGSWTVKRVFSVNGASEIINVISVADDTGLWDPGEKLEVEAKLPKPIESVYLIFVLPDGTQATYG